MLSLVVVERLARDLGAGVVIEANLEQRAREIVREVIEASPPE